MKRVKTLSTIVSVSLLGCWALGSAAQAPGGKPMICVVMPSVQMAAPTEGQGEPGQLVLNSLVSYLAGPAADVQALQSRIQVQFTAEAAQKGCGLVVETDVVQKKAGKGMSSLLAAGSALAGAVPFMGGMGGSASSYAAAQVASAAAQGAAQAQAQASQEEAAAAMSGAAQNHVKKGDQITLTYKLYRSGNPAPVAGKEFKAKAEEAGQDVLSPLLEQMATDVLTIAMQGGG
jgi:hypothetical protein